MKKFVAILKCVIVIYVLNLINYCLCFSFIQNYFIVIIKFTIIL